MDSLRVLIFNWHCWLSPNAGGAEVFTREVAQRLRKSGHEITLFTSEYQGCKKEEIVGGVRIVRAGGKYSVYEKAKRLYNSRFSKEKYDIIVDEVNTIPFCANGFVKKGETVIVLIHQLAREYWFYETPFPFSHIGYYILEPRWLRSLATTPTVTVSRSTLQDLLGFGFLRASIVKNGLSIGPMDELPEKEEYPVILFVGRLKRAKRPEHALRAFKLMRRRVPQAEMWVIGDGYDLGRLQKMEVKGVRFFGRVSEGRKHELLRRGWVLVHPSVREGWGLNVLEAAAFGVPTVAYDVAGLRDSVRDGITGMLVTDDDVAGLGKALGVLLENDELRRRFGESALEYARGFSWERTTREFLSALNWAMCER